MSSEIKVKLEGEKELLAALAALQMDVQDVLEAAVQAGAEVVKRAANQDAPGPNIEAETVERKSSHVTVAVGPDKEHWYYRFAESGTEAHEVTGKPLAFIGDDGNWVFPTRIDHPGTEAEEFLESALERNSGAAEEAMGDEFRKAVEKNGK